MSRPCPCQLSDKIVVLQRANILALYAGKRSIGQMLANIISEGQLYIEAQSGVTLFRDLLASDATPAIVPTPNSYSRRICSNSSTLSLLLSQLRFLRAIHEAYRASSGGPNLTAECGRDYTTEINRSADASRASLAEARTTSDFDRRLGESVSGNAKAVALRIRLRRSGCFRSLTQDSTAPARTADPS